MGSVQQVLDRAWQTLAKDPDGSFGLHVLTDKANYIIYGTALPHCIVPPLFPLVLPPSVFFMNAAGVGTAGVAGRLKID